MKVFSEILKKSLLVFIFLILFFPIAQNNLNLFKISDLKGYFDKAPNIIFSFNNWMDRTFQDKKSVYLNENFGLRNILVRINGQIKYDLFKNTSNEEAVFGKEGYFFGNTYLKSYNGEDFIGVKNIIQKCTLIKALQDSLQSHGQIFLPVLAPNKVRVLNFLLPESNRKKNISNYEVLVEVLKKMKIKYIDFNAYFKSTFKIAQYPLYTKYGTHWSAYGHTLAADTIINYLNYNYNLNMPVMVWKDNMVLSDSLRDPDYDLLDGMNLLTRQLPSEKVAYPTVTYKNTQGNKPSLFVIGDSFNFGLERTDYHNQVFSDYKFLYYFKQLFPKTDDEEAIYKLNLKEEITNHKVILLVTAEFNLADLGWGFLEKAVNILNRKIDSKYLDYENKIHLAELNVRRNEEWFNKVVEQAKQENKNLDTMVYLNAKYAIDMDIFKAKKDEGFSIKIMKENIKRDQKWMEQISGKAKERNISIDSMITLDAIWQLNQIK